MLNEKMIPVGGPGDFGTLVSASANNIDLGDILKVGKKQFVLIFGGGM